MASILSIISLVSFIIAGISFALAVTFFFVFKIPNVIGDLSGRNAQRSIAQLRAINEKSGSKAYRTSETNKKRGKLTGTMEESGKIAKENKKREENKKMSSNEDERPETGLLESNIAERKELPATELLEETEQTGLLYDSVETTLLEASDQPPCKPVSTKKIIMLEDIMLIHTDEVI